MIEFGKLSVVGTPIGNFSDFSPRGLETLQNADLIACEDTRVSAKLLGKFGIKKPLLSYYKPKEQEKSKKIIELLLEGKNIALISDAGMPCISDPGYILVKKCYENGIVVEAIPGCSAAVSAVAVSGIDAARFVFEGFLPVGKKERAERLDEIKSLSHAIVFYEAPHKLKQTLSDLTEFFGGERNAAICRELTKLHEETIRGTLGELSRYYTENEPRGEYVIVVEGKAREKEKLSLCDAVKIAREMIGSGEKPNAACKQAAELSGISKREIYGALLEDRFDETN
ncbi:MAG: 16S rRNA (cytidine(1402)-2'-O)-methyltransferase [Oscillospiraceae bacterium]|nr:16S rRNA (cytidine(1402)-2'-O)-methyltransferase [Oscillospiraceae bacterium]